MKCDWKLLAIFDLFSFDNPIGEMMPGTEMVLPLNCLNAFELTTQITAHADPNFSLDESVSSGPEKRLGLEIGS